MQTAVRFPGLLKAAVNLYGPTNIVSLQKFYDGTRRRALSAAAIARKGSSIGRSGRRRTTSTGSRRRSCSCGPTAISGCPRARRTNTSTWQSRKAYRLSTWRKQ